MLLHTLVRVRARAVACKKDELARSLRPVVIYFRLIRFTRSQSFSGLALFPRPPTYGCIAPRPLSHRWKGLLSSVIIHAFLDSELDALLQHLTLRRGDGGRAPSQILVIIGNTASPAHMPVSICRNTSQDGATFVHLRECFYGMLIFSSADEVAAKVYDESTHTCLVAAEPAMVELSAGLAVSV